MLRRDRYLGRLVWGQRQKTYKGGTKVRVARDECDWTIVDAPHLRIISDELWEAVQSQIRKYESKSSGKKKAGRKPKYMLSQLGRCSSCGGPIKVSNGRHGKNTIKVYSCAYHKERGPEVCPSTVRRPVEKVNAMMIDQLKRTFFTEELVVVALQEARRRLEERHTATTTDLPQLEDEARSLRVEIDRLVTAVASTSDKPEPLVKAIAERQERLNDIQTRLRTAKAAPGAINLELRRMEAEAKRRIADLVDVFDRNPDEARETLRELFPDKLTFTAVQTPEGARFQVEGEAVIGRFFAVEGGFPNMASLPGRI